MFDYLLSKPLTEESFSLIKDKLQRIYNHIINNAKYYEDCDENAAKSLFYSLKGKIEAADQDEYTIRMYTPEIIDEIKSYLDTKVIDEDEAKERLNDVLSTYCYGVECFIEEVMTNYFYIRRDLEELTPNYFNTGRDLEIEDDNYPKMFGAEHAVTDLVDILFGFDVTDG